MISKYRAQVNYLIVKKLNEVYKFCVNILTNEITSNVINKD